MKRNIAPSPVAALALLALSTFAAGRALAQAPAVEADVPFQFTVGAKTLPPAAYTITSTTPGVVKIQSADKRFTAFAPATRDNQQSEHGSELVFERYGDKYFLHEVLCPAVATLNVAIPASKLEKEVRVETAKSGQEPVPVMVAGR